MADLTHLDSTGLQTFVDNDVDSFLKELDAIRKDDPAGVLALQSILLGRPTAATLQENPILAIGLMGGDDTVSGASLIARVKDSAQSVDDIFSAQKTLFKDIDTDLRETIKTLLETQGSSLTSIDGQSLLDVFSDVDGELGGGGTTTTTGGG